MQFQIGDIAIIARAEQPSNNGIKVELTCAFFGDLDGPGEPLKHWRVKAVDGSQFVGFKGYAHDGRKIIENAVTPDFVSEFLGIEEHKLDFCERPPLAQCEKCDARVVDGQCTSCDFGGSL